MYCAGHLFRCSSNRCAQDFTADVVRGPSLNSSMSQYLIARIERSPRITLYTHSEIVRLEGQGPLEFVTWMNRESGEAVRKPISGVFVTTSAATNSGGCTVRSSLMRKGSFLPEDRGALKQH